MPKLREFVQGLHTEVQAYWEELKSKEIIQGDFDEIEVSEKRLNQLGGLLILAIGAIDEQFYIEKIKLLAEKIKKSRKRKPQ